MEVKFFYGFQIMMENIYLEIYFLFIDIYIKDIKEKDYLFNVIEILDCVKKKVEWVLCWIENGFFVECFIVFVVVEGIFFFGLFCFIFWLKKCGLMLGLSFFNELISCDEGMYCDFVCLLYNDYIIYKLLKDMVMGIIVNVVEIEKEFVMDVLFVGLIGMNVDLMCQYIEFVVDCLLVVLKYDKIFNVENLFLWMDLIFLEGKINFFEKCVGDYQKSGVMVDWESQIFLLDEDFQELE